MGKDNTYLRCNIIQDVYKHHDRTVSATELRDELQELFRRLSILHDCETESQKMVLGPIGNTFPQKKSSPTPSYAERLRKLMMDMESVVGKRERNEDNGNSQTCALKKRKQKES